VREAGGGNNSIGVAFPDVPAARVARNPGILANFRAYQEAWSQKGVAVLLALSDVLHMPVRSKHDRDLHGEVYRMCKPTDAECEIMIRTLRKHLGFRDAKSVTSRRWAIYAAYALFINPARMKSKFDALTFGRFAKWTPRPKPLPEPGLLDGEGI
jgi:hypothetical protein